VPDRIHEPFFERGHEDAIRDPVGGIGGGLAIWDCLKLLRDRPGFEEEFAYLLEEKDGAIGGSVITSPRPRACRHRYVSTSESFLFGHVMSLCS